ncbi:MAG: ABC transporter permease [Anaerolineae bacterium]
MATFVISRLTFLEAMRRRILTAALVLGIAFLLIYGIGVHFMTQQALSAGPAALKSAMATTVNNFLALAGLYAVDFLAIAMAALIAADTLAGEINSGTIQALVTKPVGRAEIVLGKWLGFAGLLALYLLLMAGGVLLITYINSGYVVPNLLTGFALIYLSALLVMTGTIALSSTLSTLATGGVIFGLYGLGFIGGWVEQFGAFFQNQTAVNVGILTSLLIPSDALWRRAAYEMTPTLTQSLGFSVGGPFITISLPSPAMVAYAVFYLGVALFLAIRQFGKRDL